MKWFKKALWREHLLDDEPGSFDEFTAATKTYATICAARYYDMITAQAKESQAGDDGEHYLG